MASDILNLETRPSNGEVSLEWPLEWPEYKVNAGKIAHQILQKLAATHDVDGDCIVPQIRIDNCILYGDREQDRVLQILGDGFEIDYTPPIGTKEATLERLTDQNHGASEFNSDDITFLEARLAVLALNAPVD